MLALYHNKRSGGLLQDRTKAIDLWKQVVELGSNSASHYHLSIEYIKGGDLKKTKFHLEAAALAGNELARYNVGCIEVNSRNLERAVKHYTIAASAGDYCAMHECKYACLDNKLWKKDMST